MLLIAIRFRAHDYNFLFKPFHARFAYSRRWTAVTLGKAFVLVRIALQELDSQLAFQALATSALVERNAAVQALILLTTLVAILVAHMLVRPLKEALSNQLEAVCLAIQILLVFLALTYTATSVDLGLLSALEVLIGLAMPCAAFAALVRTGLELRKRRRIRNDKRRLLQAMATKNSSSVKHKQWHAFVHAVSILLTPSETHIGAAQIESLMVTHSSIRERLAEAGHGMFLARLAKEEKKARVIQEDLQKRTPPAACSCWADLRARDEAVLSSVIKRSRILTPADEAVLNSRSRTLTPETFSEDCGRLAPLMRACMQQ